MNIETLKNFNIKIAAAEKAAAGLVGQERLNLFRPLEAEWKKLGGRKAAVDALAKELGLKAVHEWTGSKLTDSKGGELIKFRETRFGLEFSQNFGWPESEKAFEKIKILIEGVK